MKQKKRTAIQLLSLLSSILLSAVSAWAVPVKFSLRSGNTYEYSLKVSHRNSSTALESTFNHTASPGKTDFQVNVIDFENGAFVVDIKTEKQIFRRYLKENGSIAGAPSEAGQQIPFFISFPDGDWQPGQKQQLSRPITIGRQSFPAAWQLLLKSVDQERQTAEILFSCTPKLPSSRLAKRQYKLQGRLIFDLNQGLINQADWTVEYAFSLIAKEIAVTRKLWEISEKTEYQLKLVNILENL